jgi:CBS domain containing-hemolysin-like protein
MIHSVVHFGDLVVRQLMVPRPDIVAIDVESSLAEAHAVIVRHGFTRLPAYRGHIDQTEGIVHARDVLGALLEGRPGIRLAELLRPAHFVPESKRAAELLREMQKERFHFAMVIDEYGAVSGVVTLENLLEELVGDIAEEHEPEERDVEPLGGGRYRVDASLGIHELSQLLGTELPVDRWNTVGGLMFGLLGAVPAQGQAVSLNGVRFTAEKVQGRRVTSILVAIEETTGSDAA